MKKKKVSIYCKGYRQSVAYYRNYQYFDHIEEITPQYRVMMSENFERKYMPISKQLFCIKIVAYFHSLRRVTCQLMKDYFNPPDALMVHRRFVTKFMPLPLKWLVQGIHKKGVPIFWDIDDNIKGRELTNKEYELLSEISTGITVTHEFLRDTIDEKYRDKVSILHTTDGDLYKQFNTKINDVRLISLNKEVRMVWVATNVNLLYLESVAPFLDDAANALKLQTGKTLFLSVVCNGSLDYPFKHLKVNNIRWTRKEAISQMMEAHIGIMPLIDDDFTRGKGGFKLVQYQSIGLPTIASDVGFNASVVVSGSGYLIKVTEQNNWKDAVLALSNPVIWKQSSIKAFANWNEHFSYDNNLQFWKSQLLTHSRT